MTLVGLWPLVRTLIIQWFEPSFLLLLLVSRVFCVLCQGTT